MVTQVRSLAVVVLVDWSSFVQALIVETRPGQRNQCPLDHPIKGSSDIQIKQEDENTPGSSAKEGLELDSEVR